MARKKKYKIIDIRNDTLVVIDENGNGYIFLTPVEYKNAKIGDTILF